MNIMNRIEIRSNYCDEKSVEEFNINWVNGYALWLETKLQEMSDELSKLHQPTVISSVCDNCRDVQGMYLGTTCPKCNRPFRSVKQTDL